LLALGQWPNAQSSKLSVYEVARLKIGERLSGLAMSSIEMNVQKSCKL